MSGYVPLDSTQIPRFAQVRTFLRLPNVQTTQGIDYAVFGIPFDTGTTFRPGARFGPAAIRDISALIKPYNYDLDVNVAELLSGVDYGDLPVVTGYIEDTYEQIVQALDPIVQAGVIPIGLGGDHSVTLGELRSLAKVHGPLALVHFDSHTDTVDSYFGKKHCHGTPFARALEEGLIDTAHSIQVGIRGTFYSGADVQSSREMGFDLLTSSQVHDMGINAVAQRIIKRVADKKAFLTFDIDFADPACAPGTGTPEIGGFTGHECLRLVRSLKDIHFVGFDVVEVLPMMDPAQITALLAANIAATYVAIIAYQKKSMT